MINLSEIVDGVLALDGRPTSDQNFHQYVYRNLDVRRGQQSPTANAHLVNPLNDNIGGFNARNVPLTGAEKIDGNYLTLQFGTHDDDVYLLSHASLNALETHLSGDSGVFNPFVSWIYAIVNGRVRKYIATFQQGDQSIVFSKDAQFATAYGNKGACDMKPFVNRQIQWDPPSEECT